jgi:hypothetical protein
MRSPASLNDDNTRTNTDQVLGGKGSGMVEPIKEASDRALRLSKIESKVNAHLSAEETGQMEVTAGGTGRFPHFHLD